MTEAVAIIFVGALAGGFVSGLTGFGTGLTALPVWLLVLPPVQAGSLVVICSIVGQLQVLPSIWHAIEWRRVAPFIAGGMLGIPVGTAALVLVTPELFRLGVGVLLVSYCTLALFQRQLPNLVWGGKAADAGVGFAGGILGGIAGLSGVLPTLWTGLRGWDKATRRAVFQSFNLVILTLALMAHAVAGVLTPSILPSIATALPATLTGVWIGHRVYRRLPDARYNQIVLILLLFAGGVLIISTVSG